MSFTRMDTDLNFIQKLSDDPNEDDGLSAASLKKEFDKGPNAIKNWINTILLVALEATSAARNIGISGIDGMSDPTNVQDALQAIVYAMADISQGSVADGSITTQKLADDAVTEDKIADGAVTSDKLDSGSVGSGKLASGAVGTTNMADGSVTADKLASSAVTEGKISDGAVTTDKIGASAITAAKINDGAVTGSKLGDNSVTAGKIGSNAVSSIYSGTLAAASWLGAAAPYTQDVTINGILATDEPIIDLVPSSTYATAMTEDEEWGYIYRAVTSADTITFYAKEKPTGALNFKARCIRK